MAAISDPSSPEYGHFLNGTTLAPFVETSDAKELVRNFLEAQGFAVTDGASPLVLDFAGRTGLVQNVFHLHGNLYQDQNGRTFYSADTDPTLPQDIATNLGDFTGLENYTTVKPAETPCSGQYCAQAVEVGYTMTGLYSTSFFVTRGERSQRNPIPNPSRPRPTTHPIQKIRRSQNPKPKTKKTTPDY